MTSLKNVAFDYDQNTSQVFRGEPAKTGEIGVEIECEAKSGLKPDGSIYPALPRDGIKNVQVVADGSLRGESAEYVFRGPQPRGRVPQILADLANKIEASGAELINSYRTSVHVHVNVGDTTVKQLFALVTLYLTLEDLLVEYSGETRVGNLFCLRAQDAEHIVEFTKQALQRGTFTRDFGDEHMRYSAMNLTAVPKYGSLEFRSFRGTTSPDAISTWVRMLTRLKDRAIEWGDPRRVIEQFSAGSPTRFLESVFVDEELYRPLMEQRNFEPRLFDGMRLAQSIAYATDWDAKPKPKKANPDAYVGIDDLGLGIINPLRPRRNPAPRPDAWGRAEPVDDCANVHLENASSIRAHRRAGVRLQLTRYDPAAHAPLGRHEVWDPIRVRRFGMNVNIRDQMTPGPWWQWDSEDEMWYEGVPNPMEFSYVN